MRRVPDALVGECPGRNHADEEVAANLSQCIAEVNVTRQNMTPIILPASATWPRPAHSVAA